MFRRSLTVGRIAGIAVRVDVSWLAIAALVMWSFYNRFNVLHGYETAAALPMAAAAAVLFFASILVHELAHALEAQHRGVEVAGITLFLFGGVTESKFDVGRPRDEFALTAVGPFSSFVLASLFALAAHAANAAGLDAAGDVAGALGWLNLALGLFNLLPGAPLDGGRILRSIVWWITKDRQRSVRAAALTGRTVGMLILFLGLLQIFFVRGALIGGLWLAFIGWFLMQAALAELVQSRARQALEGVAVRRLVVDAGSAMPDDTVVSDVIEELYGRDDDHVPVRRGEDIVGVVGPAELRGVKPDERDRTVVGAVMRPVHGLPTVAVDSDSASVLDQLAGEGTIVAATDDGRVVGLITPHRLARVLRRSQELEPRGGRR